MRRYRVIPTLLLKNGGLYKTLRFKEAKYVGDPINAVKILNEKGADELLILDIGASRDNKSPDFGRIAEIASEAFVPVGYGGGIKTVEDVKVLLNSGVEKVVINTAATQNPMLIQEAASMFGSQSIVAAVDVSRGFLGRFGVYIRDGQKKTGLELIDWIRRLESSGAGEILINSIDRDGTFSGYDLQMIKAVSSQASIPVVACGGASSAEDFVRAVVEGGASAVAAGSMFVFQRSRAAVLISFPSEGELVERFYKPVERLMETR